MINLAIIREDRLFVPSQLKITAFRRCDCHTRNTSFMPLYSRTYQAALQKCLFYIPKVPVLPCKSASFEV